MKNPDENKEERDLISYMEESQDIPGKVIIARVLIEIVIENLN